MGYGIIAWTRMAMMINVILNKKLQYLSILQQMEDKAPKHHNTKKSFVDGFLKMKNTITYIQSISV